MKVLWFTNTPSLAGDKIGYKLSGGGWISSLEKKLRLQPNVKLAVAFCSPKNLSSFIDEDTIYYPIVIKKRNKFAKHFLPIRTFKETSPDKKRLIKIIHDFKPDIIHIHGTENSFGEILYETDIPVVISIQGILTVIASKYFSGISRNQINRMRGFKDLVINKIIVNNFNILSLMADREKKVLQKSKYIIGRTAWDRRVTSIIAPHAKYFHGDEVLRSEFYENTWKWKYSGKKIIITSTVSRPLYKGIETIFQASELLSSLIDFKWYVIGIEESDLILKGIKKKILKTKELKNVVFTGMLDANAVINCLIQSNLYVHPSHIENGCNSIYEAMLLGMPIVATFAGGIGSSIRDKETGILVQDGDPWAMAGAILEIINNSKSAKTYGENARRKALYRHNPDRIITELISAYNQIIKFHKMENANK